MKIPVIRQYYRIFAKAATFDSDEVSITPTC